MYITLYDIILDRPEINIVQATPQRSNLDIFPESKKEDENNETSVFISDLSFATFEIRNGMSVRYLSVPDSTDVSITLSDTRLNGNNAPDYSVDIHGLTSASVSDVSIKNLSFVGSLRCGLNDIYFRSVKNDVVERYISGK